MSACEALFYISWRGALTQIRVREAHEQQQEGREDHQDHAGQHVRPGAPLATAVVPWEVIRLASALCLRDTSHLYKHGV